MCGRSADGGSRSPRESVSSDRMCASDDGGGGGGGGSRPTDFPGGAAINRGAAVWTHRLDVDGHIAGASAGILRRRRSHPYRLGRVPAANIPQMVRGVLGSAGGVRCDRRGNPDGLGRAPHPVDGFIDVLPTVGVRRSGVKCARTRTANRRTELSTKLGQGRWLATTCGEFDCLLIKHTPRQTSKQAAWDASPRPLRCERRRRRRWCRRRRWRRPSRRWWRPRGRRCARRCAFWSSSWSTRTGTRWCDPACTCRKRVDDNRPAWSDGGPPGSTPLRRVDSCVSVFGRPTRWFDAHTPMPLFRTRVCAWEAQQACSECSRRHLSHSLRLRDVRAVQIAQCSHASALRLLAPS